MKTGTLDKMKFMVLKTRLGLPRYQAMGLLEGLWYLTATNAQDGAIGRFSDLEIAAWLEWAGDPAQLIQALVDSGFLDRSSEHRLIVHDWADHAPMHVKANLSKYGGAFVKPDSKEPPREVPKEPPRDGPREAPMGGSLQTKPNPTQPNPTDSSTAVALTHAATTDWPPEFERAWSDYPRRSGDNPKRRALSAWRARLKAGHTAEALHAGVLRYRRWCEATGKIGTETVKQAATFFGPDESFLQAWDLPATPLNASRPLSAVEQVQRANKLGPWAEEPQGRVIDVEP